MSSSLGCLVRFSEQDGFPWDKLFDPKWASLLTTLGKNEKNRHLTNFTPDNVIFIWSDRVFEDTQAKVAVRNVNWMTYFAGGFGEEHGRTAADYSPYNVIATYGWKYINGIRDANTAGIPHKPPRSPHAINLWPQDIRADLIVDHPRENKVGAVVAFRKPGSWSHEDHAALRDDLNTRFSEEFGDDWQNISYTMAERHTGAYSNKNMLGYFDVPEKLCELCHDRKYFVTQDVNTYLTTIAAFCGCHSVTILHPTKETPLPRDGQAFGFEDIPRANKTRKKLLDTARCNQMYSTASIGWFVKRTQKWDTSFPGAWTKVPGSLEHPL
jgi:hypothetical protein